MNILVVSVYDATQPSAWGGRLAAMTRVIGELQHEVSYFSTVDWSVKRLLKPLDFYWTKFQGKRYSPWKDRFLVKHFSRRIDARVREVRPDVVLSLQSPGSQPFSYCRYDAPTVTWADSTFAGVIDYYDDWRRSNLAPPTLRDGLAHERMVVEKADRLLFYSDFACKEAAAHYSEFQRKIFELPVTPGFVFDEGLAGINKGIAQRLEAVAPRLLFSGTDWKRKGLQTAIAATRALRELGVPASLHVVGVSERPPVPNADADWVRFEGFLDLSDPAQCKLYRDLFLKSAFFLLPTQAEAFGLVFLEAASFGLPSVALATGGVTSAVVEGKTGHLFPADAAPRDIAEGIRALWQNPEAYRALAQRSAKHHWYHWRPEILAPQLEQHLLMAVEAHRNAGR